MEKSSESDDLSTQEKPEQKQERVILNVQDEQEAQHWLGGTTASGKLWPNRD